MPFVDVWQSLLINKLGNLPAVLPRSTVVSRHWLVEVRSLLHVFSFAIQLNPVLSLCYRKL